MENDKYIHETIGVKDRPEAEKQLGKRIVSNTIIIRVTDIDKGSQSALPCQPWYPEQKWISEGEHYENVY